MKKPGILKNIGFILTILINIGLLFCVIFLMNHAQNLLNSDSKVNLMEIVTQNKDVITSKLMLEMNNMRNLASKVSDQLVGGEDQSKQLQSLIKEWFLDSGENNNVFLADVEGMAYYPDGVALDISGRNYFKLALNGTQNISDKLISRLDGIEKFIISVPIYHDDLIVGTAQKSYTHDEMYDMCSVSLFSSKGYMYIINSEGYSLLHTIHEGCNQKSDNFFRDLYAEGNQTQSDQMSADIKDNKAGFMEMTILGEKIFSAYTPINAIHDWYLITSVPIDAVSANGTTVINLFYVILLSVVIIFATCLIYFLQYKNKQRANVERIAFVDSVTAGNTYNKFLLDVEKILTEHPNRGYGLLKFDMDNFRYVNSYYGFEFGDKLLAQIYLKVNEQLSNDEIVARMSGDNFVILLEDYTDERLNRMLNSLHSADFTVYLSAGLYVIKDPKESISLMVDKASTAARSIKGTLNKQVEYYSEKFDAMAIKSEQLKRAVSQAILNSEFIPFYQPKVNIETGDVVGAEALARWITVENQMISPGEFIPMCEKTGIITEIDMMIFEKVLRFLKGQLDRGEECVTVSVNFSRVHLSNEHFIDNMVKLVKAYGVPANYIEVELTESIIFDNMSIIYDFTNELRTHGFGIAMDDFGSGYSSLNMLKDIPIDVLKIDKEFLSETREENRRNIIFSTVVDMAKKLGIKVVAEGVEYVENVELMRKCGCTIAQGYLFAKPMEEHKFLEYMNTTPAKIQIKALENNL